MFQLKTDLLTSWTIILTELHYISYLKLTTSDFY